MKFHHIALAAHSHFAGVNRHRTHNQQISSFFFETRIDTSYSFGENLENADYNTLMKFTAVIAAQSMDVLICSQAVYDNYSKDDYFLDLSTLFDEATCEKYGI